MNSLVCEGRLVAAAVVARLRFAVEIVPVMGALDSSQDESFTITACWRYCKDQEPSDPIYSNVFSLFPEHWTGEDQSVVKKKKILEEVCEEWALLLRCQTEGQEREIQPWQ